MRLTIHAQILLQVPALAHQVLPRLHLQTAKFRAFLSNRSVLTEIIQLIRNGKWVFQVYIQRVTH